MCIRDSLHKHHLPYTMPYESPMPFLPLKSSILHRIPSNHIPPLQKTVTSYHIGFPDVIARTDENGAGEEVTSLLCDAQEMCIRDRPRAS